MIEKLINNKNVLSVVLIEKNLINLLEIKMDIMGI